MGRYEGLDAALRRDVLQRDNFRCRWCGATNLMPVDPHHIRYRRGASDDVLGNLISLDRMCHDFVHGAPRGGLTISKGEAQVILFALCDTPGVTGLALRRQWLRAGHLGDLCPHGVPTAVGKCWECSP